jgi:hypothetical protein
MRTPLDWQDELTFGKHKGKNVGQVFDEDPAYLFWMANKTDWRFKGHVQECIDAEIESPGSFGPPDNYWGDHA